MRRKNSNSEGDGRVFFLFVCLFSLSSLGMRRKKARDDKRCEVIKDGRFSIIHRQTYFLRCHRITARTKTQTLK